MADIALSVYGSTYIQIQVPHTGSLLNRQCGIDSFLINGHCGSRSLRNSQVGIRSLVDDLLDIARHLQGQSVLPVQLNGQQTIGRLGSIFNIGVRPHMGHINRGITFCADRNKLIGQTVHYHFLGRDISQNHTAFTGVALASSADHDSAQNSDVIQQHISKAHASGDVQVTGNHGILQMDAGSVDNHIAVHAAQSGLARLLHQITNGLHQNRGSFTARDIVSGTEGTIGITAYDTAF